MAAIAVTQARVGTQTLAGTGILGDMAPGAVIAGAVLLLALPSAVLAFASRVELPEAAMGTGLGELGSGTSGHEAGRALSARAPGTGPLFRFTPAGLATRPNRSVTVAVRVDAETARSIIVQAPPTARAAAPVVPLRLVSTAYNLGVSRGYQGFGASSGFTLSSDHPRTDLSDPFSTNPADSTAQGADSRLSPRVQLGERERTGRAPRTLESAGEQSVDVGGSYRLTRNIDVTAGVRYSQDRDRTKSPVDTKSDGQAVYVGTQFRF